MQDCTRTSPQAPIEKASPPDQWNRSTAKLLARVRGVTVHGVSVHGLMSQVRVRIRLSRRKRERHTQLQTVLTVFSLRKDGFAGDTGKTAGTGTGNDMAG